jgi:hypothetical protein
VKKMARTSTPDFEPGTLNAYAISGGEIHEGDRFGYKVVAVVATGWSAWAAYKGPTSWSDEQVANEGDIISKEAASALFPTLAASINIYHE